MSTMRPTPPDHLGRRPTAARFKQVFDRTPTSRELVLFEASHHALLLGVRAKVRRRAASLITRL
jgi:hypothetical protein